jgi:hypothetical protein
MSKQDKKQLAIIIISIAVISIILCIIIYKPREKIMEVNFTSWTYTIQIQQLRVVEKEGWSYPPSDAYDVTKRRKKRKTEKVKDSNGKVISTRDIYDTWYEYKINEWQDSREITTHGMDKEPYWGEVTLSTPGGGNAVGDEREHGRNSLYEAVCHEYDSTNTENESIKVSESLWKQLKREDQLVVTFVAGKVTEVVLAQ